MYDEIYTAYFKIVCFHPRVEGVYGQEERVGICTNKTGLLLSYLNIQVSQTKWLNGDEKTICNNKLQETSLFTLHQWETSMVHIHLKVINLSLYMSGVLFVLGEHRFCPLTSQINT